jgi:hypothetical protein
MKFMVDEEQRDVSEKRVFPRGHFSNPVEFRTRGSALSGGCLPSDISQGGIRVNLNMFVPLNAELNIQIQLGLEKVVACSGRVVWIRKVPFSERYQAGLKFLEDDVLANAKNEIGHFINKIQVTQH